MALTTIPTPEEGEVVGGRAIMSVQQRMKQALKMRAVWAGFLLIVIACVPSLLSLRSGRVAGRY